MYDLVSLISDIIQAPLFQTLAFIFAASLILNISLKFFRWVCIGGSRRRPVKEIEAPAKVSREILISESPVIIEFFRWVCIGGSRRRPVKEIEAPAKVSREILISESPVIIECCADCPLYKSSGLRDEQCKLHGTAFCCVGRKLTEKGGVNYE